MGLRMSDVVAQNLQARAASGERHPTTDGVSCQTHQLLSGGKPVVAWSECMQLGGNWLYPGCNKGLSTRIQFEQRQGRWPTRISEHLTELGKQHLQQRMDLVAVARDV